MGWAAWALVLVLALGADRLPSAAGLAGAVAAAEPSPAGGAAASGAAGARLFLGYYVPYDPTSWASLEARAASIDVVAAQWVTIDGCGRLTSDDDQDLKRFARVRGIRVVPSLLTLSGWLNHRILTDPETSERAIGEIVEYVLTEGYDGFDLDLEAVRPADRAAYTDFVARLGAELRGRGKLLTLAVPAKATDLTTGWGGAFDYAALGPHADLITVMAYEFHGAWGGPGPVAPYDGVERVLAYATATIPPEKVLLGLAFYGYDWNVTSGGARYLGYPEAAALAERHATPIDLDPATRSSTFRYRAPGGERPPAAARPPKPGHEITRREPPVCPIVDPAPSPTPTPRPIPPAEAIQKHEVWLEAADSAAARLGLADRYRAGGVAAWCLGLEDPAVWELLGQWRAGGG